jgi:hypothetical protein
MQPSQGDRVKVLNIPEGYPWADLYENGVIDTDLDGNVIHKNGLVGFFTGANHFPYKDRTISISGCGNCVHISRLKYTETKPGTFWKFKDGIPKAGGAEYYEEQVNWFECEFSDVK